LWFMWLRGCASAGRTRSRDCCRSESLKKGMFVYGMGIDWQVY
jgi:hypothetical protein